MKILVAEDDLVSRKVLVSFLEKWGHDVISVDNGAKAVEVLSRDDAPSFAILDWMMPEKDGADVCRWVRARGNDAFVYIILLTAKTDKNDIVAGLSAGADDYVAKPFNKAELQQRIKAGERIILLEAELRKKIADLENAMQNINQLHGILPICAWCKKVRGGDKYWQSVESYISSHSDVDFTHGICPECLEKQQKSISKMLPTKNSV